MNYNVLILRSAQKELAKLENPYYEHICSAIRKLAFNPRPFNCKKLIARPAWRIRIGPYRVIYEINDREKTVLIMHVGHRRDVY